MARSHSHCLKCLYNAASNLSLRASLVSGRTKLLFNIENDPLPAAKGRETRAAILRANSTASVISSRTNRPDTSATHLITSACLSTIPVEEKAAALAAPEFATIGAFYDAIKEQIKALGPSIFVKTTAPPQVVNSTSYSPDRLFPITDVET